MKSNNKDIIDEKSSKIVTIGTFDGVHLGHQKILSQLAKVANEEGLIPTVLTLFPHPRMVLQKESNIKLLNTIDERISLLRSHGIKEVIVKEFTKDFANLSPSDYVEQILVKELNTKKVVIGYDHHFGKNRSANIKDLKAFAKSFNFDVDEISAQEIKEVTVSSTKIRTALEEGKIETANSFLGYNYFLSGIVIHGKGLGRNLNFPTANISIKEDYKLIPRGGVYVVQSVIDDVKVFGMMNIGTNPTVDGKNRSIEVHFFNFKRDIYGKNLKIECLYWLRSEEKFENLEALKTQLSRDKQSALDYIITLNE